MHLPIIIAVFIIAADQATKFLAQKYLSGGSLPVINGVFHLTLTSNKGAAFSILRGATPFFILIGIVCVVLLMLSISRPRLLDRFLGIDSKNIVIRTALGLVLGGAAGNLIDRIRFGSVIDFLDFRVWPVFNLADSAITVGGIFICYKMLFKDNKAK